MAGTIIGSIEIIGIKDNGNLEKERLLLRATESISLEYYIIVNVGTSGEGLDILNDKVFWFPVTPVKAGEYIRLYTKKGVNGKTEGHYGDSPAVYHNFHWGLDTPIWDGVKSKALTIFQVNSWNTAYPPQED